MLDNGFSCDNTMIPYTPTITACGHTCVYTGSVPAIHGITGNHWWDNQLNRSVYCTEDRTVKGVGSTISEDGNMSPANMFTTTVCDELRLATNFRSKVIGISLKDRGAILPAGHSANAAYWYDGRAGKFISSTYYMQVLPDWVQAVNNRQLVDSFYRLGWKPELPDSMYTRYATEDIKLYEGRPFNRDMLGFPYDLSDFIGRDYSKISTTPYGNTLVTEMAKAAIRFEHLGKGAATDFLAISFSSPDYIGHAFGPDSWELVDNYVRLDKELGILFAFIDKQLGAGSFTAFLTADHAVAHIPGFLKEHKLPNGLYESESLMRSLNERLKAGYGIDKLVMGMLNYQVSLNHRAMDSARLDRRKIVDSIISYLSTQPAVANVFETKDILTTPQPEVLRERLANGYFRQRSGDVQVILKSGYIDGNFTGTTHGVWYAYDAHIPLLWYGYGVRKGNSSQEVYMTDIAPTLSSLLKIQMPSGSIGKVILSVLK